MTSYSLKIVLLGDSGVGKTQLSRRQAKNSFYSDSTTTVGVEFSTSSIEFEKCTVKAQLWDAAGQHRMENVHAKFLKHATAAALVYDVTRRESLQSIQKHWLPLVREWASKAGSPIKIMLVGNKLDLVSTSLQPRDIDSSSSETETASSKRRRERDVSLDEVRALAEKEQIDLIEVSARSGFKVDTLFRRLALCVAKDLATVKSNLELTDLPEGWLAVLPKEREEREREGYFYCATCCCRMKLMPKSSGAEKGDGSAQNEQQSPSSSDGSAQSEGDASGRCPHCGQLLLAPAGNPRTQSTQTATTRETYSLSGTASDSMQSPLSIERESDAFSDLRSSLRRSTSQASPHSYSSYTDVIVRRGRQHSESPAQMSHNPIYMHKLLASPLRVVYMNYWTGEERDNIPTSSAPTGLLYTAPVAPQPSQCSRPSLLERNSSASTVRESCESVVYDSHIPSVFPLSERTRSRSFAADDDEDAASVARRLQEPKATRTLDRGEGVKMQRCCGMCVIS